MDSTKKVLICGAGGFIGGHLAVNLIADGYQVIGADLKIPEFRTVNFLDFYLGDLRNPSFVSKIFAEYEIGYVFQLAADMGGAGFVFTGDNDLDILHNSALINLNVIEEVRKHKKTIRKIFYSSSACIYPEHNQQDPQNPICTEASAYPANPDSEYGWEKLFSERLYQCLNKNEGVPVAIARYHNIYGPYGTYAGGREKAPAAMCRKLATTPAGGTISIWGTGQQTRSFLYIDDCISGTLALMNSDYQNPVNIGSEEMVTIDGLVDIVSSVACKKISVEHISGPVGVNGRNSDNEIITRETGWSPKYDLNAGIACTYEWISKQCKLYEKT